MRRPTRQPTDGGTDAPYHLALSLSGPAFGALRVRLAIFFVFAISAAVAGADVSASLDLSIGLKGHFRLGEWTPVSVTGVSEGPLAIRTTDANGVSVEYPLPREGDVFAGSVQFASGSARCVLLAGPEKKALAAFYPDRVGTPHRVSERIWATSGDALGFELGVDEYNSRLEQAGIRGADLTATVITGIGADPLPEDTIAVANVVVVSALDSVSAQRLRLWTAAGGHLILADGLTAEQWSASDWSTWVPIDVGGPRSFRNLNALETAVPGGRSIGSRRATTGVALSTKRGRDVVDTSVGPLIVRVPYGQGFVTALAVPLSDKAIQDWLSLGALTILLADDTPPVIERQRKSAKITSTGVTELETQIWAAVDGPSFPGREKPAVWTLLGQIMLAAFVLAGIDFFVVHYVLRRPQLTWITLPIWSVSLFVWATSGEAVNKPSTRTISLVDFDTVDNYVSTREWSSVASPVRDRFSIAIDNTQRFPPDEIRLRWSAPPEPTFGGLYRDNAAAARVGTLGYSVAPDWRALDGVPFLPGGTKLYVARGMSGLYQSPYSPRFRINVSLIGSRPAGTIWHNLPGTLEDWWLVVGRSLMTSRDGTPLANRETFTVNATTCELTALRDTLTGLRRIKVAEESKVDRIRMITEQDPYDASSTDIAQIIRMASFFERAGGTSYTGLRYSGSPANLDLSKRLDFDDVIIVGRFIPDTPSSHLSVSKGDDVMEADVTDETWVRLIAPLTESRAATGDETPIFEAEQ